MRQQDDLLQVHRELQEAYDATLKGWVHGLDLRDRETADHSRRVTLLTVKLGRLMGISDSELIHVRRGALLHDIGKLGVPDQTMAIHAASNCYTSRVTHWRKRSGDSIHSFRAVLSSS